MHLFPHYLLISQLTLVDHGGEGVRDQWRTSTTMIGGGRCIWISNILLLAWDRSGSIWKLMHEHHYWTISTNSSWLVTCDCHKDGQLFSHHQAAWQGKIYLQNFHFGTNFGSKSAENCVSQSLEGNVTCDWRVGQNSTVWLDPSFVHNSRQIYVPIWG